MAMVETPAPKSLSIMTSLRFQRSTSAPAMGLKRIAGPKLKNATSANAVAEPVISYAQIVSAKVVIDEPSIEMTCPNQTIRKARIPVGLAIVYPKLSLQNGLETFE